MADLKSVFRKTRGINNVVDPVAIDGATPYLAEAVNVDIDDTGRVSRVKGYLATDRTEASRSIFSNGTTCLFVSGTTLYRLEQNYSRTALLASLTPGAIMAYLPIGDVIYFSNGRQSGMYANGVVSGWSDTAYVGPTTTKRFSSPPAGGHLEVFNGQVYIASGNTVYFTERYAYSRVNMAANFLPFEGQVGMVKAVQSGIYFGTDKGTYFAQGTNAGNLVLHTIDRDRMLEHSAVKIDGSELKLQGSAVFWASSAGIMLGGEGGEVRRISEHRISFPSCERAFGLWVNGRYVLEIEA